MSEINLNSSGVNNNVIDEEKELKVSDGNDYTLFTEYHESEIKQNKMIITNAVDMIWLGIFMLMLGLFFAVLTEKNFIAIIPGAFVDLFAGTVIYLVNKSSETKQKYFENLSSMEHEKRIIELIHTSSNEEFKEEMISKLVDKHCKNER